MSALPSNRYSRHELFVGARFETDNNSRVIIITDINHNNLRELSYEYYSPTGGGTERGSKRIEDFIMAISRADFVFVNRGQQHSSIVNGYPQGSTAARDQTRERQRYEHERIMQSQRYLGGVSIPNIRSQGTYDDMAKTEPKHDPKKEDRLLILVNGSKTTHKSQFKTKSIKKQNYE